MKRLIKRLTVAERAVFIEACLLFMDGGPNGGRTPFKHRGRDLRGVDCIGVPVFAMRVVGREVNDLDRYAHRPDGVTLQTLIAEHLGAPLPRDKIRPADIVLMRWHEKNGKKMVNHVGVVMPPIGSEAGLYLLHAYHGVDEVIHHRIDAKWMGRIVEAYRP